MNDKQATTGTGRRSGPDAGGTRQAGGLCFRVRETLFRAGGALFQDDDEFARLHGWQIEPGRFGLSRTYRHPGFDRLAACDECGGLGLNRAGPVRGTVGGDRAGMPCARCGGTGRVTVGGELTAPVTGPVT